MQFLVVDDEIDFCETLGMALEMDGHQFKLAFNGQEGLELCSQYSFDFALIDIFMPEKDGLEMIQEVLPIFPELKIIAMSGFTGGHFPVALNLGAKATLKKPFELNELWYTIEKILNEERL